MNGPLLLVVLSLVTSLSSCAAAFLAYRAAVAARDASANCYLATTDAVPPAAARAGYVRPHRAS